MMSRGSKYQAERNAATDRRRQRAQLRAAREQAKMAARMMREIGFSASREEGDTSEDGPGRIPYGMRRKIVADRADRVPGLKWTAGFRSVTGDPPLCPPGQRDSNLAKARVYLAKIERALSMSEDAVSPWTDNDMNRLRRLRRVWQTRVSGNDARFNLYGTSPGRPSDHDPNYTATLRIMDSITRHAYLQLDRANNLLTAARSYRK